jgi:hypothetical protein
MKEIRWPTPFGYALFCDDIRNEADGKTTLVGVYSSEMVFHAGLPAVLPKFGIVVKFFELPNESKDSVKLEIFLPGDSEDVPSIVSEIPFDQIRAMPKLEGTHDDDMRIGATFNLVVSPLNILKEGHIRVRAIRGDQIVRLGRIRVIANVGYPPNSMPAST